VTNANIDGSDTTKTPMNYIS